MGKKNQQYAGQSAQSGASPGFRVASLNIHGFRDASHRLNLERVVHLLALHAADVVALQEAHSTATSESQGRIAWLQEKLDLPCLAKAGEVMILSRLPIQIVHPQHNNGCRFISVTVSPLGGPSFQLTCLHLDHFCESKRLTQWAQFDRKWKNSTGLHILCGDFNALTRMDYDEVEWKEVAALREQGRWEPPQVALTARLRSAGWRDAWQEARPNLRGPRSTSRFDTRVDYIYTNDAFNSAWTCAHAAHVPTSATDHALVLADFTLRKG